MIHIKPLHHITAHHSTSRLHSTSHHAMHIATLKCKLHAALSHSTQYKLHHTSHIAFQPSFRITPPCLNIWRRTIQHPCNHSTLPYSPCTTPSFHIAAHYSILLYYISNRIISATLCITTTSRIALHFTQHCTALHMLHILHNCIIPPHLTVIPPNSTPHYHFSHNIPQRHHILYQSYHLPHLATPPTLPRSAPCHTPHSTSFHITQRSTFHPTAHTTSFHITNFHIPSHTLPHSTSHNVPHSIPQPTLYLVPHHTTFNIPAHTLPHSTSHNVPHSIPHSTSFPHHTTFHIPSHSPHSTSFHITAFHIPSHSPHSTSFHITTFHIPSHSPHSTSFHITTFHIPSHTLPHSTFHATVHTPIHITLPIYITPFQFERLERYVIRFCYLRLSFAYNLLYCTSIKPNTKMVKKCNFTHKVPEKVMPVCPNTNLSAW